MNIRDLQYLVAIADNKHFGKAAEASFVSQPTLSAQLKKLEEYLGVQLVERSQRQVIVTPIGQQVIEKARAILKDVNDIQEIARQSRDPYSGNIKLGTIPTLGPYLLPHIIPFIKQQFSQLELFLYEDQTARLVEKLKQAELDAIILALPIDEDSFIQYEIFQEFFYVALPYQHRLAKKKTISTDDLAEETLLLLTEGHCLRDQALEVCSNVHIKQKHNFSATSLETLRQMVIAGAGITLLPELAINYPFSNQDYLVIKSFNKPQPYRNIALLWRKSTGRAVLLQKMGEMIKKQMSQFLHKAAV